MCGACCSVQPAPVFYNCSTFSPAHGEWEMSNHLEEGLWTEGGLLDTLVQNGTDTELYRGSWSWFSLFKWVWKNLEKIVIWEGSCRKYPCTSFLWICLLRELLQSLFHVQLGWNFNTKQPLYVQPFCLWPDENPLAWSGAIHHQKKAIILAVNCQSHQYFAHYLVSKVLFKAYITSAGIILPSYETMQPI